MKKGQHLQLSVEAVQTWSRGRWEWRPWIMRATAPAALSCTAGCSLSPSSAGMACAQPMGLGSIWG